jgi:hypothetical protein
VAKRIAGTGGSVRGVIGDGARPRETSTGASERREARPRRSAASNDRGTPEGNADDVGARELDVGEPPRDCGSADTGLAPWAPDAGRENAVKSSGCLQWVGLTVAGSRLAKGRGMSRNCELKLSGDRVQRACGDRVLGWAPLFGYLLTAGLGIAAAVSGCATRDPEPATFEEPIVDVQRGASLVNSGAASGLPSVEAPSTQPVGAEKSAASDKNAAFHKNAVSQVAAREHVEHKSVAASEPAVSSAALTVKRFVVTTGVADREPLDLGETLIAGAPVFAFTELASGDGASAQVEVVFEHESGRKVGHAKLDVPAAKTRWRTWGVSRNVSEPGRWVAVLLDGEKRELSRVAFTVSAAAEPVPLVANGS